MMNRTVFIDDSSDVLTNQLLDMGSQRPEFIQIPETSCNYPGKNSLYHKELDTTSESDHTC